MDSAKDVLRSTVLAIQQVRGATSRYSVTRGVRQVRKHSLIRLESDFQTIADVCQAILEILDDPLRRRHFILDDRWVDWLSSGEPETCLDVLRKMGGLLSIKSDVQVFSGITTTKSACKEDDIHAAIVLFHAHKAHFHFLLMTDIWNHENGVHRQMIPLRTEAAWVQGHEQPQPIRTRNIGVESQRTEIIFQKLKKLLKILDRLDCSEKHRETSLIRQSDTCMWLLATDAYRSWREGNDSFLWLQGKAGAGKSVLASSVINDLNDTIDDGELLVYFYCDFRTKRSTSAVEVMRSVLAQLMAHVTAANLDLEDLLDELLKENDSHPEPFYNTKGLSGYLCKAARLCSRTPIVVLDALDECREVESLLDGLIMSTSDLRIFATSRPLQNIISILSPFPCISMDKMVDELSADILLHVTRELDSRPRLRTFDKGVKEKIQSKLCAKADGMFRWVQCQIDTLEKCTSISEIRGVLESLPKGLEETYRRILIAIERQSSDARLVRRALVWLVGALRPMSMRELLEAIMVNPEYRALDSRFRLMKGADLLDVCRSLVVHHEETDIITLSHMSVKEYLVGELVHAKLPQYHIALDDAHEQLARFCMAYIAFCLDQMKESRDSTRERDLGRTTSYASRPLLKYVFSDGFNHLAYLGPLNRRIFKDMEILRAIIRRHPREWNRICKQVPSIRTGVPWPTLEHDFMLYTLVAFASDALLETFVRPTGLTPQEGTNPLVYAAHFGKTGHARVLISQGADVNHPGLIVNELDADDPDLDNLAVPLEVAVGRWNAEMIDALLAQGCIVPDRLLARVLEEQPQDFPLYITNRLLKTAEFAKWAITTPWENRKLLEALIDDAEDHGQVDGAEELAIASRRLVEVGCAETLLLVAVGKGCIFVIETLLSISTPSASDVSSVSRTHAIMDAVAPNGDTPLHIALRLSDENQCLAIMKLLVECGCNPRGLDGDDRPLVHIAVVRGFISVVEYLLSLHVPLPSKILLAALQVTPLKRVEMTHLLVRRGANVYVLNPDGDALLHIAMRSLDRSVCAEIAKIFIDAGCDSSARNLRGETPLSIAAMQEYREIGNYLVLLGTSSEIYSLLDLDPSSQATALRSLIGNEDGSRFLPEKEDSLLQAIRLFLDDEDKYLAVTKRLVGAPGDLVLDCTDIFDGVIKRGFCSVVDYLLSQHIQLPHGILFTALRLQPSMVPFLIRKGIDLGVKEKNGDTLLHVAMATLGEEAQCCSTVQALVGAGCRSSTSNNAGEFPIDVAVSRGFPSVVEYLLSQGTPLPQQILFTALRDQASMVPFLVCKGADLHAKDKSGDTPLQAAMRSFDEAQCLTNARVLWDAGCRPSTPDYVGRSPVEMAVFGGFPSVVEYFLSQGTELPQRILFTALQNRASMVPFLIRKGAQVHVLQYNGDTPLHVAMNIREEAQCLTTTRVLISAGCHSSTPNKAGQFPIEVAVSRGFLSVVEYLLSKGTPLPQRILFTALKDQASMVPFLIRKRAEVHVLQDNGDTLLHVAMNILEEAQCLTTTQILVGAGCHSSTPNKAGRFPIQVAVSRGFVSLVEYLLSQHMPLPHGILFTALRDQASMIPFLLRKGADVHVQKNNGDTLLHVALSLSEESQCHVAVQVLVKAGCLTSISNAAGTLPVHIAVSRGFISVAKYLLSLTPHDSVPPDLLFSVSPCHNSSSMVRLLVDHGANLAHTDPAGNCLLHRVMQFSNEKECLVATQVLIQAGFLHFVTTVSQKSLLHAAVEKRFTSVAEYLIANDVPLPPDILPSALKRWPMHERDPHKWESMVSLFIRKGANIHAQETNGDTLMHYVMRFYWEGQSLVATKFLVEAGCSTSVPNTNGELPIQIAVAQALPSVVEFLLSHDSPFPHDILLTAVQARENYHQVPQMITLLVRNGVKVSVRATNGDSVLHVALVGIENDWYSRNSLLEVVKILVREGCDPCARNSRGRTLLEVAVTMGYSKVEDYLRTIVPGEQLSLGTPLPTSPTSPTPDGSSVPGNSPPTSSLLSSLQRMSPTSTPPPCSSSPSSPTPSTPSSTPSPPSPPSPPRLPTSPPQLQRPTHTPLARVRRSISNISSRRPFRV